MSFTHAVAISPEQMTWNVPPLEDPAALKAHVGSLHADIRAEISNLELDELIYGIGNTDADAQISNVLGINKVTERYAMEETWFPGFNVHWTPYRTIRAVARGIELRDEMTVYDLGCAYGRVPLYTGITTAAKCKGVELVGERVDLARRAQERLELDNVEFSVGNVRDVDYSDGDVFYMYSPFNCETLDEVLLRLKSIAKDKPILVVARGQEHIFVEMPWLKRVRSIHKSRVGTIDYEVAVFESDM